MKSSTEEAKERALKCRNEGGVILFDQGVIKCHKFKIIEENVDQDLEEETPQPFIAIRVGNKEIQTYAFIDSGADGNTISYELYTKLQDAQLTQTDAIFEAYTCHQTKALGCCALRMFFNELNWGTSSLSPKLECRMSHLFLEERGKDGTIVSSIGSSSSFIVNHRT